MRHVLTAISQIVVAIYVFHKSWSSEKRWLQAGILIFTAGILKCIEKPLALRSASISSLMSIKTSSRRSDRGVQSGRVLLDVIFRSEDELYRPFVDLAPTFKGEEYRFWYYNHEILQLLLYASFDRLYTKEQVSGAKFHVLWQMAISNRFPWKRLCGYLLRAVVNPMIFTALGLFHKSQRGGAYSSVDVKVTYILLSCTASLEYFGGFAFCLGNFIRNVYNALANDQRMPAHSGIWPDQIAQYNLIGYLTSSKKHRILRSIAASLGCQDYLDRLWCMKPRKPSHNITSLVGYYIEVWKDDHQLGVATNRSFSDNRGHWTLKKQGCGGSEILRQSLLRPFDESVLLWHLATEFCYHTIGGCTTRNSRVISNYMAYLLFINPEMLMTGARPSIFRDEYERLQGIPLDEPQKEGTLREEELARKIIQKVKGGGVQGEEGVADAAWALSKELMDLCKDDSERMWNVIEGVWVEMLCFSASRCRGYLHAKSLGKGGEYLSYIWLLQSFCGIETLAEKVQKVPDDNGGATYAAPATQETTAAIPGDNLLETLGRQSLRNEQGINDGADCTTQATAIIGDEITDDDGGSHCTTSATPTCPIIGDNNV